MNPAYFFLNYVSDNLTDFEADPRSIRKAFNAAVSIDQLADHWVKYWKRHQSTKISGMHEGIDFIIAHKNACEELGTIRNISNVYKHLYVNTKLAHYEVGSPGAFECVSDGSDTIESGHQVPGVTFVNKNGERREVLPILRRATDWWGKLVDGEGFEY